ncbi:MAG: PspC domain-containing protein [Acidimicrobiales bacterium]
MTWNDPIDTDPHTASSTSNSGPRSTSRRLERRAGDKVLGGVCGGIADYFGIDAVLVRVVTGLLAFTTGIVVPAYLVAWLVVPEAGSDQSELERLLDRSGLRHRHTDGEAA